MIPAERLATLFEPFRREPKDAARSTGLGLGLFICQQIALAHGGDIAVASAPDTGTVVTVRLPRSAEGSMFPINAGSAGHDASAPPGEP